MSYVISCCSSVDLPKDMLIENDIKYIPMHFTLDSKEYKDDLFESMSASDFYKAMSEGKETSTSQVNADEYREYFESFLKEGKDILHICLSSGLTGTMNSALNAKNILQEEYPDAKIYLVDSLCASCGYGILALKAAEMRDNMLSIDEAYERIEEEKNNIQQWFFTSDLSYFVKGGRLSAVSGWFGTVLRICPLLEVDLNGKLTPREKCRGKQNAINACFEKMQEFTLGAKDYCGRCFIAHSACPDDAKALENKIVKIFPKLKGKIVTVDVGAIIGSHTGPGTTGLFFEGLKRK